MFCSSCIRAEKNSRTYCPALVFAIICIKKISLIWFLDSSVTQTFQMPHRLCRHLKHERVLNQEVSVLACNRPSKNVPSDTWKHHTIERKKKRQKEYTCRRFWSTVRLIFPVHHGIFTNFFTNSGISSFTHDGAMMQTCCITSIMIWCHHTGPIQWWHAVTIEL